jgi:hypothetical protein
MRTGVDVRLGLSDRERLGGVALGAAHRSMFGGRGRSERWSPFPRRTTARTPAIAEGEPSVRVTPLALCGGTDGLGEHEKTLFGFTPKPVRKAARPAEPWRFSLARGSTRKTSSEFRAGCPGDHGLFSRRSCYPETERFSGDSRAASAASTLRPCRSPEPISVFPEVAPDLWTGS